MSPCRKSGGFFSATMIAILVITAAVSVAGLSVQKSLQRKAQELKVLRSATRILEALDQSAFVQCHRDGVISSPSPSLSSLRDDGFLSSDVSVSSPMVTGGFSYGIDSAGVKPTTWVAVTMRSNAAAMRIAERTASIDVGLATSVTGATVRWDMASRWIDDSGSNRRAWQRRMFNASPGC